MTTNHPVPTPPPAEPAASLRPVEEPDLAALVRWVQLLPTAAAEAAAAEFIAPLLARLRAAEETLAAVGAIAEKWRYKGEFGWGAWQEGHGPDQEGHILDECSGEIRAALAEGV